MSKQKNKGRLTSSNAIKPSSMCWRVKRGKIFAGRWRLHCCLKRRERVKSAAKSSVKAA